MCWCLCVSEVPRELIQQARGGEVNLNLEDHRHEDYVKPRTAVRAFAGEGRRLGWYATMHRCLCICEDKIHLLDTLVSQNIQENGQYFGIVGC